MGTSSIKLKLGIYEISDDEIIIKGFRYCQNKLCGVRNTTINNKYCSIECADFDACAISGREWVKPYGRFWVNAKIPLK